MIYVKVIIMLALGHGHPWDSMSQPVLALNGDRVFRHTIELLVFYLLSVGADHAMNGMCLSQ